MKTDNRCGEHTCPRCDQKFWHILVDGESCYQAIGPNKWKICPECYTLLNTAPLFIDRTA